MAKSDWLSLSTVVIAAAGMIAGMSGVNTGWAWASKSVSPGGQSHGPPGLTLQIQLGWLNSTTTVKSGWVPATFQITDSAAQALGTVAALVLLLGTLASVLMLVEAGNIPLPEWLQAPLIKRDSRNVTALGIACLALSASLYIALTAGTHKAVKDQFGDNVSVWPTPDWACGGAVLGSACLILVGRQLQDDGDEEISYEPINDI